MNLSSPPLPTTRVILYEHGRSRLAYIASGREDGPPLVLIHGLSGSRRWWRRNLPALEEHFHVYALDLVGFGDSRRQRPLPIHESAALLGDWLESLSPGPVRVIGHSMGAHTALHLAATRPELIERLVLAAASALVSGAWWRIAARLPLAVAHGAFDFLPTLALDAARAGPLTLYSASREILHDDVSGLLSRVNCPTLLVWGERDVLVPRVLGERLAAAIPGSRFVEIEGAGHNLMYDRAAAFNAAVLPFLLGDPGVGEPSGDSTSGRAS